VATFDEAPAAHPDDDRRAMSLRDASERLRRSSPAITCTTETRRLMSVTVWESDEAMTAGEEAVRTRPAPIGEAAS